MFSLVKHQNYFRVMEIKKMDLFKVDRVRENLHKFSRVDLGHDDESGGRFERIKFLGKIN